MRGYLNLFKKIIRGIMPPILIVYKGPFLSGKVALTFDDGPHDVNTEKILDILGKENIKATFFVSGSEIEKRPNLLKKYVEAGHELGNHSYLHKHRVSGEDMSFTSRIIFDNSGQIPKYFRPPYGKITPLLLWNTMIRKMALVMWSVDSDDSIRQSSAEFEARFRNKEVKPGDIILFHEDYDHTRDALRNIIKDIKARGLGFATVSEMIRK